MSHTQGRGDIASSGFRQIKSESCREFSVPGDMSSAAVIIGATLCTSGKVELRGVDSDFTSIRFSDDGCGEAFWRRNRKKKEEE